MARTSMQVSSNRSKVIVPNIHCGCKHVVQSRAKNSAVFQHRETPLSCSSTS